MTKVEILFVILGGLHMKVQSKNVSFFIGEEKQNQIGIMKNHKEKKKSFFVSVSQEDERIQQKREAARKKATKLIRDQFESDNSITDSIDEARANIEALREEQLNENSLVKDLEDKKKKVEEQLKSSMEQGVHEENLQLQEDIKEFADAISHYSANESEIQKQIRAQIGSITQTKNEMLKTHKMVDDKKLADEIIESASDEIKGMLIQEGVDKIKEEEKEAKEKAEKAEKEKEEQEEQVQENIEELKKEMPKTPSDNKALQENEALKQDIANRIKQIMVEDEILEEELKGLMVDCGV